jgi:gamma-D-glutamyl-L-lysine dipeptidyl-peptidase
MIEESHRVTVCTPVAQLFAEPKVASAQISQLLAGRVADVLETRDDWYRVRGPDAYEGWVHRGHVGGPQNECAGEGTRGSRISLGCITTTAAGMRRAMPLGAFLSEDERIDSGEVLDTARRDELFPADALAITRSALRYFEGTSYLWGGVTPWGADCSGLVQSVFWLHGITLNRDAWQQSKQGGPGEKDMLESQAGDLLFFSDRVDQHVTHVAIALGQASLVHLALGRGGYAVERLDDSRDPYVRKLHDRFVTARRIQLNS